MIVMKAVMEGW